VASYKDRSGRHIGTGATAIQAIPEIAKQAKQLTGFQRRPNCGRCE